GAAARRDARADGRRRAAARGRAQARRRRDRSRRAAAARARRAAADRRGEPGRARTRPRPGGWDRYARAVRTARGPRLLACAAAGGPGGAARRGDMSAAPLAALAAALGVLALWDALAAVEAFARGGALGGLLAPLGRARRAGAAPSAPERRRLALVAALGLLAAGWLVAGLFAGAVLAAGGPWALRTLVRHRRRRYRAELARAVPAVARAVADALAAGHAISRALAGAARSLDGAAAAELAALGRALALGESLEAALARLQARAGSRAYDTLATAILLQRDAGGDLVALLRELARAHEAATRANRSRCGSRRSQQSCSCSACSRSADSGGWPDA